MSASARSRLLLRTQALLWAFALIGTAALIVGPSVTAQGDVAPQVRLRAQARYLSSATANGTLDIVNTADVSVGYNPMSVAFLIRNPDGSKREEHWITTISSMPRTTMIAPGRHRTFEVTLPACEVFIDPCMQRVAVKLELITNTARSFALETNEISYSFVPDPATTFTGLRDDLPLFITRGEASDVVPQDELLLTLRFDGGLPQGADDTVTRVLANHGLRVTGLGTPDPERQYYVPLGAPGAAEFADRSITAAIADLQRQLGSRVHFVSKSYLPLDSGFDRVFGDARAVAQATAERLATFLRAGTLSDAGGLNGDGALIRMDRRGISGVIVSGNQFHADASVAEHKRSPSPGLIDVDVQTTQGFVGNRKVEEPPFGAGALPSRLEYQGSGLVRMASLPINAMIAADRPELFAIAATTRDASERLGYDPGSIATALAYQRTRALARALGLGAGNVSLVAEFPAFDWSGKRRVIPYGVALTATDESSAAWRRLVAPTPTPAPAQTPQSAYNYFLIAPVPRPTPTPNPLAAPEHGLIPIEVPGEQTTLSVRGDDPSSQTADELRIDVAFHPLTQDDVEPRNLPDPDAVVRVLRAQPLVVDVAIQGDRAGSLPVGYEIIMRTTDMRRTAPLVALLRARYARVRADVKYDQSSVLSDCSAVAARALQASVEQATQRALESARVKGRTLRRLLLAAQYPQDNGDACLAEAQPQAVDLANAAQLQTPYDQVVTVHTPVVLVFRLFEAKR